MGRELRRKQAKKEGKSLEREEIIEERPIRKFLIITCILVLIASIIYLLTALFITKEIDWFSKKENNSAAATVSNAILASAIFKQNEETYYVYFYDFDEEKSTITEAVNNSLLADKVYKVNTSSAMNANYVGETSNKDAKTLEDLKVVAPTLIKISGDTIVEYYEGNEITDNL